MTMPQRSRDKQGRFEKSHGISKTDVFQAMEPLIPYTTGELAKVVGAPRRTVFNYLEQLHEEDRVRKKKPEPRRAIWMRGK